MPDDPGERQWIVEPPGPGEVALHFAVGDGVELTDGQLAALTTLLASFEGEDAEVAGYSTGCPTVKCGPSYSCPGLSCPRLNANIAPTGTMIQGTIIASPRV